MFLGVVWGGRLAEASCVNQILTARAVASDMGKKRAGETGVSQWASCHLNNSERDVHRTVKKQKTTLDIPIKSISCSGVNVPWIPPHLWLCWIVRNGLWPTLAGCSLHDYNGSCRNWSKFWKLYQKVEPDHDLFEMDDLDLSRTAGFCIHGDHETKRDHGDFAAKCSWMWLWWVTGSCAKIWHKPATGQLCWALLHDSHGCQRDA